MFIRSPTRRKSCQRMGPQKPQTASVETQKLPQPASGRENPNSQREDAKTPNSQGSGSPKTPDAAADRLRVDLLRLDGVLRFLGLL